MPYITKENREVLDPVIDEVFRALGELEMDDENNNTEGNLNYILTRLLMLIYGDETGTRYTHINDAMGVLACVQAEFYRAVAAPYEDIKRLQNGPVKRHSGCPEVVGTVEVTDEQTAALNEMVDINQATGQYD